MTPLSVLTTAAVSAWLGIMAFFSFVAAPVLFRTMERSVAGAAAATLLPGYYAVGGLLCGLALLLLILRLVVRESGWGLNLVSAALTALMLALVLWSLAVVLPDAETARRSGDSVRFALAHRRAISLNLGTMLCAVLVIVLETVSRGRAVPSAIPPAA